MRGLKFNKAVEHGLKGRYDNSYLPYLRIALFALLFTAGVMVFV